MLIKKSIILSLMFLASSFVVGQELCSNGIDDDGDGLIDLNDMADCPCSFSTAIGEVASLIPNPSFEDFAICPSVPNQISEANSWDQMTDPGPDYFNTCDPFADIVPMPFPDGNGVAGFAAANGFLEFIGAELTSPLIAGENYRMDFNVAAAHLDGTVQNSVGPPIGANLNLTLYGNVSTTNYPIATTTGIETPAASNWEVIGAVNYSPLDTWTNESIFFTANDNYQMIAFGPPAALPFDYINANDLPYFFVDQMILNLESNFGEALSLSGELCLNNSFINSTVPDPSTQWYFDGEAIVGQTTDDIDVSAVGLGAGTYTLAINPPSGCVFNEIIVNDNIYPVISYTQTDLCPPGLVTLESTSFIPAGTIDSTVWDFGFDTIPAITAIQNFDTPGNFNVTLSVFSDIGCQTDSIIPLSVEDPPIADFSYQQDCFNVPLPFTDLSTPGTNGSPITSFIWDFDGTGGSMDQNPTHLFPDTASYDVTLTVSTAAGCSDDTTITVMAFAAPIADFSNTVGCEGDGPIEFTDLSTISSGTITDLDWNFGDMTFEGNVPNPSHQYPSGGDYNVTLTATSNNGCIDTHTEVVSVGIVNADISLSNTEGCAPLCVDFSHSSTTNTGSLVQFEWEFSNGTSSNVANPTVCFNNPSNINDTLYSVKFIVTSSLGCQDSVMIQDPIFVYHVPKADFDFFPTEVSSINPVVNFINESIGGDNFVWQFGEEGTSMELDPDFSFTEIGLIPVTLSTSTEMNCTDTITKFINIKSDQTIFVPNSFTPDEDGLNDLFFPIIDGANVEFYEFKMYDRYGHTVFETDDHLEKWNGHYKNELGSYTADGQYSWLMKIRFENSTEVLQKKGTLYIIR